MLTAGVLIYSRAAAGNALNHGEGMHRIMLICGFALLMELIFIARLVSTKNGREWVVSGYKDEERRANQPCFHCALKYGPHHWSRLLFWSSSLADRLK